MILVLLGLAIAGGSAAQATSEPKLVAPPDWIDKPTIDELKWAWPRQAYLHGIGGRADMNCRVEINGQADDCEIVRETPTGFGFGAAALSLVPRLRFTPAMTDKGPSPWRVNIPVNFESDAIGPSEEATDGMAMGDPVDWVSAPTSAELGRAYPRSAAGAPGLALFQCWAAADGTLTRCMLLREAPQGKGFGHAGYGLLDKFRVRMDPSRDPHAPLRVDVPIRFESPDSPDFTDRRVDNPVWETRPNPAFAGQIYPSAAKAAGVLSGIGVARCRVSPGGALSACAPLPGDADRLGFSEAAARFAPAMKMSPWTTSGSPAGGTIDFRVRLTPKDIVILAPSSAEPSPYS